MFARYLKKKRLKEKLFVTANKLNLLANEQLDIAFNNSCSNSLLNATQNRLKAEKYYVKARML